MRSLFIYIIETRISNGTFKVTSTINNYIKNFQDEVKKTESPIIKNIKIVLIDLITEMESKNPGKSF